jgi:hypothetical protein
VSSSQNLSKKCILKADTIPKTYILAIDNVKMLVGEIVVDFINVFLFVQLGLQEKGRQDKDEQASNSKNLW